MANIAIPEKDEDLALVRRAASGDPSAFESLFEKYREAIYNVAWRYVLNRETALDIVQDTFIRAYEKLPTFRSEANFFTWLRRIATNRAIDHLRARAVQSASLEDWTQSDGALPGREEEPDAEPLRRAERAEFTTALWQALDKLSEKHRAVFLLHAVEGLTYQEIADQVGCQFGTVMSRLYYARQYLQTMLREHLE